MSSDDEGPKPAAPAAKPAMSRFLKSAGDPDSSDESSSEESEMSSDEEEVKPKAGRFLVGATADSDSDEDVKRVVKSARDKRLDEMEATGKSIDNAVRINDWVATQKGNYPCCSSNHIPRACLYAVSYGVPRFLSHKCSTISAVWCRDNKMFRSRCLHSTYARSSTSRTRSTLP